MDKKEFIEKLGGFTVGELVDISMNKKGCSVFCVLTEETENGKLKGSTIITGKLNDVMSSIRNNIIRDGLQTEIGHVFIGMLPTIIEACAKDPSFRDILKMITDEIEKLDKEKV